MNQYVEESGYSKEKLIWMWLAVLGLLIWSGFVVKAAFGSHLNLAAVAYIFLFSGLLVWRYGISYTYVLTDKDLRIHSKILGFSRQYTVPLGAVEVYSDHYIRRFFYRTGISCYRYHYCSGDKHAVRIVVFCIDGKKNAVLFKVGDAFMNQIQRLLPNKCLDTKGL
ncbi:MAG: hypothetical protein WCS30_00485 [Selenomonadaceae bacterium]